VAYKLIFVELLTKITLFMTLIKKISLLLSTFILFVMASNAQNIHTENTTKTDPIEFIQNYLPVNTVSKPVEEELAQQRMIARTPKAKENFGEGMLSWVKDKYADVLEVLPSQISNVMLYRFIDEWYGVKYRMGGTSKNGIDCSAFVQTLYQYVFGFNLLRTAGMQFGESQYIKSMSDLKEGDLVFFRINTSRISHVGVYLKNNFFVHSASSKGVSIANLTSDYWNKYFAGGGRILN
jgi:lipoprotein Spr